jgi:type IV secretory pathway VirB6-like protein
MNWGNPVVAINSNPTPGAYKKDGNFQTANWTPTQYYLNGKEIYFVVQNSYAYFNNGSSSDFYYKSDTYTNSEFSYGWAYMFGNLETGQHDILASILAVNGKCNFCDSSSTAPICRNYTSGDQAACFGCKKVDFSGSPGSNPCDKNACASSLQSNMPTINSPCFMDHGMGVYMGISPQTTSSVSTLIGAPIHMGFPNLSDSNFYSIGNQTGGVSIPAPETCNSTRCQVNFKALDKFYDDNYGTVQIELVSGVEGGNPGIITKLVGFIEKSLCWARAELFQNLVLEPEFQSYIRALLILYIVIYGIVFLMGLVQVSQKDFMIRVMKIAIILQLTDSDSWDFFNDNFFAFFTQGVSEITSMIFGSGSETMGTSITPTTGSECKCNTIDLSGFQAIDDLLHKLFGAPMMAKLGSLMYNNWLPGFFGYCTILVLLVIIVYVLIKNVFVYILSSLALSIIIVLAPIFIPFILFSVTRSFFGNWLKQLISYFIQPIIVLAFMFFVFQLVVNQLYYLLGFSVCSKEGDTTSFGPSNQKAVYSHKNKYWMPVIATSDGLGHIGNPTEIPIPNFHIYCSKYQKGVPNGCYKNIFKEGCGCQACQPFQCTGERYVLFPYLDPELDSARIDELKRGVVFTFDEIIFLMFLVYFMLKFAELVPQIAKDVAGTPMNQADMNSAATAMRGGVIKFAKNAALLPLSMSADVIKAAGGIDIKANLRKVRSKINVGAKWAEKFRVGFGRGVYKMNRLKKDVGSSFIKAPYTVTKNAVKLTRAAISKEYRAKLAQESSQYWQSMGRKTQNFFFSRNYGDVRESRDWVKGINAARDAVGGYIDTSYHAPKRAMQQRLYNSTYGLLGKDSKKEDEEAKAEGELSQSEIIAEQHRMNMERLTGTYQSNVPRILPNMSRYGSSLAESGKKQQRRGGLMGRMAGGAKVATGYTAMGIGKAASAFSSGVSRAGKAVGGSKAYKGLISVYDKGIRASAGIKSGAVGGRTIGGRSSSSDSDDSSSSGESGSTS